MSKTGIQAQRHEGAEAQRREGSEALVELMGAAIAGACNFIPEGVAYARFLIALGQAIEEDTRERITA